MRGRVQIARLLIEKRANVNAKDKYGWTPLHYATGNCHVDILHLLVDNGANLEAQNNHGSRALHKAAYNGQLLIVQELISRYHVDINARDNDGETSFTFARDEKDSKMVAFLQVNGGIV